MKWNACANDDRPGDGVHQQLQRARGRLPRRPERAAARGTFAVAIGTRRLPQQRLLRPPHAPAQWHHYAFVLDTAAPAAQQIIPYVDGQPVAYTKVDNGTGAGPSPTRRSPSCRAPARACSAPATSTTWRSTTAPSAPPRSPTTSPAMAPTDVRPPPSKPRRRRKSAKRSVRRLRLQRPRRDDRQIRMGPRRQRQLRDQHRHDAEREPPTPAPESQRRPAGDRQLGNTAPRLARSTSTAAAAPAPTQKRPRHPRPGRLLAPRRDLRLGLRRQRRRQPGHHAGAPTLGVPGGVPDDTDTAARFDGATTPPAPPSSSPARPRSRSSSG